MAVLWSHSGCCDSVHVVRRTIVMPLSSPQALWSHADRAYSEVTAAEGDVAARQDALRRLRSSLAVLAMVAAGRPDEALDRLPLLLKVRASSRSG